MDVNLTVSKGEFDFLMQMLGELPSKTGAYTLMVKFQQQAAVPAEEKKDGV